MSREANQLQNTGAWFNERTGKLTASRMAAAINFLKSGAESSERRKLKIEILAERLTGNIVPKYVTNEMQWGIDREPEAKDAFFARTGLEVMDVGFVDHPEIDMCGCSPDGYIRAENALIEIKCPSTSTMISWLLWGKVPDEHIPQMTLQSACFGGIPVYFCAYDPRLPEKQRLFIRKFQPTPEQIADMEQKAVHFLNEIELMFEQLTVTE